MKRNPLAGQISSVFPLLDKMDDGKQTPCAGGEESGFFAFPCNGKQLDKSRSVCAKCPIRKACFSHARENEETGVWGGFYFDEGRVRKGRSAFIGRTGVRVQSDEEMFEETYVRIPVDKLDDFNAGKWNPPAEDYDDDEWDKEEGIFEDRSEHAESLEDEGVSDTEEVSDPSMSA